jgi:SOS-response transcriptional repressor LexA
MNQLTPRQHEVLAILTAFQDQNGYPPTCQEIADQMSLSSPNAAAEHLKALERKGAISITKYKARGIQIIGMDTPAKQRDEALDVIRDLLACNVGCAERALSLLSRYQQEGENV